MDYTHLKKALEETHTALERGEILMRHRVLLAYMVEKFEDMTHVSENYKNNYLILVDTFYEALGTTAEVVEDEFYGD